MLVCLPFVSRRESAGSLVHRVEQANLLPFVSANLEVCYTLENIAFLVFDSTAVLRVVLLPLK